MKSNIQIKKDLFNYGGWALILALLIIIPSVIHDSGYGIKGFMLTKPGQINISNFPVNGEVYINGKKSPFTSNASRPQVATLSKIRSGNHSFIVSKDGYFPWTKTISLNSGQTVNLKTFNLPQNSSGVIIGSNDPEYYTIKSKINNSVLPTRSNPKISADGKVAIFTEGQSIKAKWLSSDKPIRAFCIDDCTTEVEILPNVIKPIKNIEFFKNWNDVIVFSSEGNVNVIELDRTETQNFQPAFTGTNPNFTRGTENTIYIQDGDVIFEVGL